MPPVDNCNCRHKWCALNTPEGKHKILDGMAPPATWPSERGSANCSLFGSAQASHSILSSFTRNKRPPEADAARHNTPTLLQCSSPGINTRASLALQNTTRQASVDLYFEIWLRSREKQLSIIRPSGISHKPRVPAKHASWKDVGRKPAACTQTIVRS